MPRANLNHYDKLRYDAVPQQQVTFGSASDDVDNVQHALNNGRLSTRLAEKLLQGDLNQLSQEEILALMQLLGEEQ